MQFGEMAEWLKAAASKAAIPCEWDRGFESPSLLQTLVHRFVWQNLIKRYQRKTVELNALQNAACAVGIKN